MATTGQGNGCRPAPRLRRRRGHHVRHRLRPAGQLLVPPPDHDLPVAGQLHDPTVLRFQLGLAVPRIFDRPGRQRDPAGLGGTGDPVGQVDRRAGGVGGQELVPADVDQVERSEVLVLGRHLRQRRLGAIGGRARIVFGAGGQHQQGNAGVERSGEAPSVALTSRLPGRRLAQGGYAPDRAGAVPGAGSPRRAFPLSDCGLRPSACCGSRRRARTPTRSRKGRCHGLGCPGNLVRPAGQTAYPTASQRVTLYALGISASPDT